MRRAAALRGLAPPCLATPGGDAVPRERGEGKGETALALRGPALLPAVPDGAGPAGTEPDPGEWRAAGTATP